MGGVQLEGAGRLFLPDILLDQAAGDQALGVLKRIGALVVLLFGVDGREPLLLAHPLHQLQRPLEFAGGAQLVAEGGVGILFDVSHVPAVIDRPLQPRGIQRQVQLQRAGFDIDFGQRGAAVEKAFGRPADAGFVPAVGQQRVFQLAVIVLDVGPRLNQLGLKALAVVRNNVIAGGLVKADDFFVAGEVLGVVGLVVKIIILAVGGVGLVFVLVLLVLPVGGSNRGGNRSAVIGPGGGSRRGRIRRGGLFPGGPGGSGRLTLHFVHDPAEHFLDFAQRAVRGGRRGMLHLAHGLGFGHLFLNQHIVIGSRTAGIRSVGGGLSHRRHTGGRRHVAGRGCGGLVLGSGGFLRRGGGLVRLLHGGLVLRGGFLRHGIRHGGFRRGGFLRRLGRGFGRGRRRLGGPGLADFAQLVGRDKIIPGGTDGNQQHQQHQRAQRHQPNQQGQHPLRGQRQSSRGKKGRIIVMRVSALLLLLLQNAPATAGPPQFAHQQTDAGHLHSQHTGRKRQADVYPEIAARK